MSDTPETLPPLAQAIADACRPGDEYPTAAGYYAVHEKHVSGASGARPQVVWHNGRERAFRVGGSLLKAACWYGPLPEMNRRTGALEWPRSTSC